MNGFQASSGVANLWDRSTMPTVSHQSQTICEQEADANLTLKQARWGLKKNTLQFSVTWCLPARHMEKISGCCF